MPKKKLSVLPWEERAGLADTFEQNDEASVSRLRSLMSLHGSGVPQDETPLLSQATFRSRSSKATSWRKVHDEANRIKKQVQEKLRREAEEAAEQADRAQGKLQRALKLRETSGEDYPRRSRKRRQKVLPWEAALALEEPTAAYRPPKRAGEKTETAHFDEAELSVARTRPANLPEQQTAESPRRDAHGPVDLNAFKWFALPSHLALPSRQIGVPTSPEPVPRREAPRRSRVPFHGVVSVLRRVFDGAVLKGCFGGWRDRTELMRHRRLEALEIGEERSGALKRRCFRCWRMEADQTRALFLECRCIHEFFCKKRFFRVLRSYAASERRLREQAVLMYRVKERQKMLEMADLFREKRLRSRAFSSWVRYTWMSKEANLAKKAHEARMAAMQKAIAAAEERTVSMGWAATVAQVQKKAQPPPPRRVSVEEPPPAVPPQKAGTIKKKKTSRPGGFEQRQLQRKQKHDQLAKERLQQRKRAEEERSLKEQQEKERELQDAAARKKEQALARELLRQQIRVARLHYKRTLLVRHGWMPWRVLVKRREQSWRKAVVFYSETVLGRAIKVWRLFVAHQRKIRREQELIRYRAAARHHDRQCTRRALCAWIAARSDTKRRETFLRRKCNTRRVQTALTQWRVLLRRKLALREKRRHNALSALNAALELRLLRAAMLQWSEAKELLDLEMECAARRNETWSKVREWLDREVEEPSAPPPEAPKSIGDFSTATAERLAMQLAKQLKNDSW